MALIGSARLERAVISAGWPAAAVGRLARRELARLSLPAEQHAAIERVIEDLESCDPASAASADGSAGRKRVGELPVVIELTTRQAAEVLGVGERRVGQLRNRLPHRRVGRTYLHDAAGVEALAAERSR